MFRFRADLTPCVLSADRVLLLGERERIVLAGPIYGDLVKAIAEAASRGQAEAALAAKHDPDEISRTLDDLATRGLLGDSESNLSNFEAAYWEGLGVPAGEAERRLRESPVRLTSRVGAATEAIGGRLKGAGLHVGTEGRFRVVAVADYLDSALERINEEALQSRSPWLLLRPVGRQLWLGPLFSPDDGPCWKCLRRRLIENRWTDIAVWSLGLSLPPECKSALPVTLSIAGGMAAAEIAKWIVLGKTRLRNALLTYDAVHLEQRIHPVVRLPDCPKCGTKGRRGNKSADFAPGPDRVDPVKQNRCHSGASVEDFATEDRPKTKMGSYSGAGPKPRARAPRFEASQTVNDLLLKHYSHITGFVSGLKDLSRPGWAPVRIWTARYTVPTAADNFAAYQPGLATGRGLSDEDAQLTCLAEAAERHCTYWRGCEAVKRARWEEVCRTAVAPPKLLLYSPAQYGRRKEANATDELELHVPPPFDPELPVDWVKARNWTGGPTRWIPASCCFYHHEETCNPFCQADSNGCAAGTSFPDAVLRGFCELVERDAAALWWYNRVSRPSVSFDSFQDRFLSSVSSIFKEQGREVHLSDLTTDWELPVYAAVSFDSEGKRIAFAFGAHGCAKQAAVQAATELVQAIAALEQSLSRGDQSVATKRYAAAKIEDYPFLGPGPQSDRRTFARGETKTADEWLECWARKAGSLGMELLSVDLTRAEIAVPVARTIVPGLRHFWPRLAPGRLYDVPVELGWLRHARSEAELNPEPCLL